MPHFSQKVFKPNSGEVITIVSGLPRSGTSMTMKMLEAGGFPILTDGMRTANEDNPNGYYEFERVKKLDKEDTTWLEEAQGKAVKVISALLKYLPPDYTYKVIFMQRRMVEILASQRQMLIRRSEPDQKISDAELMELFKKHLRSVRVWLAQQPNIKVIYISYNDLLTNPSKEVNTINQFLGNILDEARMAEVIDPTLYRQKQ